MNSGQTDDPPNRKPSLRRTLFPWVILGIAVGLGMVVLPAVRLWILPALRSSDGTSHPSVGKPLTVVELEPITAENPLDVEQLTGRVTLMNFWGTWCYPCVLEMPYLAALHKRLRANEDFRFVSVSCGETDVEQLEPLQAETIAFLKKMEIDLPTYADLNFTTRLELARAAQLSNLTYPTTVLLDRDGAIHGLWIGYKKGIVDDMEKAARKLLATESS